MKYVYFLDVQQGENRSNAKVFELVQSLGIPDEQIFVDESPAERVDLKKLLDIMQKGDILIIRSVKDLVNSMSDFLDMLYVFSSMGVELFSIEEFYLCGEHYKEAVDSFLDLVDHFEKQQRKNNYNVALQEGRVGRPAKTEKVEVAIKLFQSGNYTIEQIQNITGVSKSTIYNYMRKDKGE